MVVIFLPTTSETGVLQERIGLPSTWTVHAPHCAMPQPNFVPVMPRVSRSTQSSGVSAATVTVRGRPFRTNEVGGTGESSRAWAATNLTARTPGGKGQICNGERRYG